MGIITKTVRIELNHRNKYIYSKLGYNTDEDFLELNVSDLPEKSCIKVEVCCDYCGKIFYKNYGDYLKSNKGIVKKIACNKCRGKKTAESNILVYGVQNVSQLKNIKQKKVETCRKNFGCDYPMQNEGIYKLSKKSMLEKYGVEHNFHREEIKNIVRHSNANMKYIRGNAPSSKAQRYLCDLYDGILNYPVDWYNLDILLDDKIYIEYNGSGHDLNLRKNQITQQEFDRKNYIRYEHLKSNGYKEIIFENKSDKLPNDEDLIFIKNGCLEYFKRSPKSNWIYVNLDTGEIKTKNAEIFYMIS